MSGVRTLTSIDNNQKIDDLRQWKSPQNARGWKIFWENRIIYKKVKAFPSEDQVTSVSHKRFLNDRYYSYVDRFKLLKDINHEPSKVYLDSA